jgi:hypothetical protein
MIPRRVTKDRKLSWRARVGYLSVATLLFAPACADIWGFDDLGNTAGGGSGGSTMMIQIGVGGASGGAGTGGSGVGGTGEPAGSGGRSGDGVGGVGAGGSAGPEGTGGVRGTGGASGVGGAIGVGGMTAVPGTGGVRGVGGTPGTGGSPGTGGKGTGGMGTGGMGTGGMGTGGAAGCGPTTCASGCCAAGRCITARTALQCGTNGAACAACGGCQLCSAAGACAIDPASNWIVRCGSAQLTVAPPTGATWDPAGVAGDGTAPDPFCQFEKPSGVLDATTGAATRTVNDSFTATWNQTVTAGNTTITAAELMSANVNAWRVWVGDTEFNGRATLACEVHPPLQAATLVGGQLTVTNLANCVSFSMALVCQP